jgi:hypothetical protein
MQQSELVRSVPFNPGIRVAVKIEMRHKKIQVDINNQESRKRSTYERAAGFGV